MSEDTPNETAERILDAAEEAFAEAGFAGARVNAIATSADVNKAMLYYYFDSKQGLYQAVLERAFAQLLGNFTTHIEGADEPDIAAFLEGYRHVLRSHPHLARLVMRDLIDGGTHVMQILAPKMPRIVGGMSAALAKGQGTGRLNPAITPMVATPVLIAPFVLFALGAPVIEGATGIPPAMLAGPFDQTAEEILLRGLLARESDRGEG